MLCRMTFGEYGDSVWGWVNPEGVVWGVQDEAVKDALQGIRPMRTLSEFVFGHMGTPVEDILAKSVTDELFLDAPIEAGMEVWAAGVTYESSKFARMAESEGGGDFYAKVYVAERPELFFKATPRRVVGPGGEVRIRADSTWNVPEPELAAVISADGKIVGYTVGNDMSSRSIEGENPLYLPQAKVYRGSCALGPWIVPAESVDAGNLGIRMRVLRDGAVVFAGETSTGRMKRTVPELAEWLFRENDFPGGAVLLTGTGIIPEESFTLRGGDVVEIEIDGIGVLRNPVAVTGQAG